jgi:hypothetical protein
LQAGQMEDQVEDSFGYTTTAEFVGKGRALFFT